MIFFQGFQKAPLSFLLFSIYGFLFLYNFSTIHKLHKQSSKVFFSEHFAETHIKVYSNFILQNSEHYPLKTRSLASKSLKSHEKSQHEILKLSLKDSLFLKGSENVIYEDHLGYSIWRKKKDEFMYIRSESPLVKWGLSFQNSDWPRRFSYQFFHMDMSHFLVNMFFFLLFVPLVEKIMGSLLFLGFYLFSAFFAALFYDFLNGGLSLAPLIGASGTVNAMLAFLCVYYGFKPVRYFWFVFPKKGFMGFIYLPALWILIFWTLRDLTGLIYTSETSVAYSSHLGGQIFGVLIALLFRFCHKSIYDKGLKMKPIGYAEDFKLP